MKKIKEKILNKEIILYIIFGIITTIINIGTFYILTNIKVIYIISNLIALMLAKIVAYLANKFIVFKKKCKNKKELLNEIISFIFVRGFTMLIDFIGLIILIEIFNIEKIISKIIVTLIVIIINYMASKKFVFNMES